MKLYRTRAAALLAAACLAGGLLLTGCHGQRRQAAFTVPDTFDTTRQYEITFWAKNDTNVRQTEIYRQAIEDFQATTATSTTMSSPTSPPAPPPTSASPTPTTSPPT